MTTVLIPPGSGAASIILDQDEAHHLRVRRVDLPAEVRYVDGAGGSGTARIEKAGRDLRLVPLSRTESPRPVPRALAVGAGDRDRFAWLVEKATELGITDVVPVDFGRGHDVATRLRDEGRARLERRARQALKQCGGAWAPVIHPAMSPAAMLEWVAGRFAARWLMDAEGKAPHMRGDGSVVAVVGPEGGLTATERTTLLDAGFGAVRLGWQVLRFETAAIAAAVLMQVDQGDREAAT